MKTKTNKTSKTVITINIAKWRTGGIHRKTGYGPTRLLNAEGYKCCLGFICSIKKKAIKGYGTPGDLDFFVEDLNIKVDDGFGTTYENTKLSLDAMNINDNTITTVKQKETLLKKLFKNSKYKFVFVGKYTYDTSSTSSVSC